MSDESTPNNEVENPQAFPVPFLQGNSPHGADAAPGREGMTLLDYFAGQALCGMLSDPNCVSPCAELAKSAYDVAISMLNERMGRRAINER